MNSRSLSQTEIIKNIQEIAKKIKSKDVLDVGCGDGLYTSLFCRNDNNVVGIDLQKLVDPNEIDFKFIEGDALNMPFPDNSFDVVSSFDVIEHLSDDRLFLKECCRVLKKSGRLILGTPNRHRISFFILSMLGKKPKFPRNLGRHLALGDIIHLREYTVKEITSLLKDCGFRIREVRLLWLGFSFGKLEVGIRNFPKFFSNLALYILIDSQKVK